MNRRPVQDVRIWNIQDRSADPKTRKPYLVRWRIDNHPHSRSLRTRPEADRFRSRLLIAQQDGERFDLRSGEPVSWRPAGADIQAHTWVRRWLAGQWDELAPRTRDSYVEELTDFVLLVSDSQASEPPEDIRQHVDRTLRPNGEIDPGDECERWLNRWTLSISELDRTVLSDVDRNLGKRRDGTPRANSTAKRHRRTARSCVRAAVHELELPADPWPLLPSGRNRRKANRTNHAVDVRRLPKPSGMSVIINATRTHQPGSRNYQELTSVTYYGGLRPSESVMVRGRAVHLPYLPAGGWGLLEVVEAEDGYDDSAEPKTGYRVVPIPPVLVDRLRSWINEHDIGPDDLLFRTRNDKRPNEQNWNRALKRACHSTGHKPLTPYDLRHACATAWLQAGVSLGEAARRLGHSVETLVAYYIGALDGDDSTANDRIEGYLDGDA